MTRRLLLGAVLLVALAAPVSAQLFGGIVYDPTNYANAVLRYGQFYGPGTYYENDPPPAPRIHVDDAARRTMPFLTGQRGIFTISEDEAAP